MKQFDKKKIIGTAISVACLTIAVNMTAPKVKNFDAKLKIEIEEHNAKCPQQIDPVTQLDRVTSPSTKEINFSYTNDSN